MAVPRIYIVFHSYGICPTQFSIDLARCMRYTGTIVPAALHEQSCYVDAARNKLVKGFLSQPDATHMMMIDVDISFDPDAVLKTFTILQALQLDCVYGNYALGNGANSIFGPPENASQEAAVRVNLEPNKVYTDITTGGTGWLMCTRQLLERMQKECQGPWHWFDRDLTTDGTDKRGEDITFGLRMYHMNPRPRIAGITTVLLRHQKNQGYFPAFMSEEAAKANMAGVTVPNPFESDTKKYIILGNSVVDKTGLTPEQLTKVEFEAKKWKEAEDARKAGARVGSASVQERLDRQASESLRLRNPEENGLEAETGTGPHINSQEEVSHGEAPNGTGVVENSDPPATPSPAGERKGIGDSPAGLDSIGPAGA